MSEKKRWKVKRYLVETYESYGDTRKEALENLASEGYSSHSVELKKETAVRVKTDKQ